MGRKTINHTFSTEKNRIVSPVESKIEAFRHLIGAYFRRTRRPHSHGGSQYLSLSRMSPSSKAESSQQNGQNPSPSGQRKQKTNPPSSSSLSMSFEEVVKKALSQISDTNTVMEDLRRLLSKHTEDIDSLPEKQKKLEDQEGVIAEKDKEIQELEITVKKMRHADQKTEEEYTGRLKELKREAEEQRNALKNDRKKFNGEKEELLKKVRLDEATKRANEVNSLKDKIKKLEKDKKKAEERAERLEEENKALREDGKRQKEDLRVCKDDLDMCEKEKKMHAGDCRKLNAKIKGLEEEFVIASKPTQYYSEKFQQIDARINELSSLYFCNLPPGTQPEDYERIRTELDKPDHAFATTPISASKESMELRMAHARRIISSKLCSIIWQPFSADALLQHPYPDMIRSFLEQISSALARRSKRKAGAWQALTTEGLASVTATTTTEAATAPPKSRVGDFVTSILADLGPLVQESKSQELRASLRRIATAAAELWHDVQRDTVRLRVEAALDPAARNEWSRAFEDDQAVPAGPTEQTAANITDGSSSRNSSSKKKPAKASSVFCLFPRVLRDVGDAAGAPAKEEVVHSGCGLAEDSTLVHRGQQEQKDLELLVEAARQRWHRDQMAAAGRSHSRGNSPTDKQ